MIYKISIKYFYFITSFDITSKIKHNNESMNPLFFFFLSTLIIYENYI